MFLEKAIGIQMQGSVEWHAFRSKHIGASQVPAILGECDFRTAYDVWKSKTGSGGEFKGNWATKRGMDAEPEIRKLYEELYSVTTTAPVLTYPDWPVLSASLDGYCEEMGIVVEFKYPSAAKHTLAKAGIVPMTYRSQLQTQLLVSGCKTAHYVSYDGRELAVVVVPADPEYQLRILFECKKFWHLVETMTPPPGAPVILESETLEVLASRYKQLDRIAAQTDAEMKLIKQKLDELVEEDKAKFCGLSLNRGERQGAIDYGKVPELRGVDLEQYRKSPIKVLTIKVDE